jgi:hypothetical protein
VLTEAGLRGAVAGPVRSVVNISSFPMASFLTGAVILVDGGQAIERE